MVKHVLALIFCGLFLTSAHASSDDCINFEWGRIESGEFKSDRASILVPVYVKALDGIAKFQLDTGASRSFVYDGALTSAQDLTEIETEIGFAHEAWERRVTSLRVKKGMEAKTSQGTIGVDLMRPGIVIDFPRQLLCRLTADRASTFVQWEVFERSGNSPVIKVNDGFRQLRLILDTGSSAFSVITTSGRSKLLAKGKVVNKYKVPSFGSTITVAERKLPGSFTALGQKLDVQYGYTFEHILAGLALNRAKIDGLIGLSPFSNGRLAFDFTNDRVAFSNQ